MLQLVFCDTQRDSITVAPAHDAERNVEILGEDQPLVQNDVISLHNLLAYVPNSLAIHIIDRGTLGNLAYQIGAHLWSVAHALFLSRLGYAVFVGTLLS